MTDAIGRRNSSVGRGATYLFRRGSSPAMDKIFIWKKNLSECMWFGCRLPVAVVSQAYPGNAEICPGFPPPQAALRIILSNEGDAVYYRYIELRLNLCCQFIINKGQDCYLQI